MSFSGQATHLLAGKKSMADLSGRLGFNGSRGGWRLEALCAVGEENIRLGLRKGAMRLVFFLQPKDSPGALIRAEGVSLSAQGKLGPAMKRFLEVAAGRLGGRTLEDIRALIAGDPETVAEVVSADDFGPLVRVPIAAGPINLMEAGWRNFFGDQDMEVILGYPELSMNKTIYARYSDRECLYSWSGNDPRKWSFFDYPVRIPSDSFGGAIFRKGIIMELEERDMVVGPSGKTDALVEGVARAAEGSDAEFVVLNHFCTSMVIGEDTGSISRRIEKATGRSAVSWSHGDRDQLNNFGEHFRAVVAKPGFFDVPADKGMVNLFYFPVDYREAELVPLLEEMGIRANVRMFPDVDFSTLADIPKAHAQIFCEATSYPSRLGVLLSRSPRPKVTAPAPFGLAGTRDCLEAVAAAAGKKKAFEKVWKRALAAVKPEWDALREEAEAHRLAFVVSETTLPMLWKVRHGQGAPLMKMIEEMGFGVDLLCHAPHGEAPELPEEAPRAALTTFRTPADLEGLLREGVFRAVYSDIVFDWRISSAGKARFSSKDFEMGLGGALRSLERLLAACRMPFYARYGGHLAGLAGRKL